MTHILQKQPLEIWWSNMLLNMLFIAAWFGIDGLLIRKPATKTYHGAALLIPGYNSGKYQEVLAAAIVWARGSGTSRSETPAIFIQKIREWTDYNMARGKPDVRPYYSYQEWCDEHFPCHNAASIQRVVMALEELGLIVTEQFNSKDLRKRYALDEDAIADLVGRWSAAHPEIAKKFRGTVKGLDIESSRFGSESPRLDIESSRFDIARHTSSKKAFKQSSIKGSSTQGTGAAARNDKSGLDDELADSDSHALNEVIGQSQPEELQPAGGDHQDSPSPVPPPPSQTGKWNTAYGQLAARLDRPTFDTLLKDAVLLACDGGSYRVGVKTEYAQAQLSRGYYRMIENVFRGLHNTPVKIEFEVRR